MTKELNGYNLQRKFFNFAFENKECKYIHIAIYCWCVELNNRFGWKSEFGLPTSDTMEGLSIGSKNTYLSAISDLVKWGFIKIVKPSKNQYQAQIIKLCYTEKDTALVTALDTALVRHDTRHRYGIGNGIDTIDKQVNKETSKQVNNLELPFSSDIFKEVWNILLQEKKWKGKSENALKLSLDQLKKYPEPVAIQMIKKSIAGGYQGLFGPEDKTATTQTYTPKQNTEFPITPPFKGIPRG